MIYSTCRGNENILQNASKHENPLYIYIWCRCVSWVKNGGLGSVGSHMGRFIAIFIVREVWREEARGQSKVAGNDWKINGL